jgi:Ca2+-binding EF-hand superfamily protein
MDAINLSAEDHSYYSEVFEMFDTDQSGAIDLKELQEAVASTGLNPTESELKVMMASVSGSEKNEVSLQEFLKMVVIMKNQEGRANELSLHELFEAMDVDKNGYISASDMFKVLENIEETLPADQIYEMIAYGDEDFDGKVLFIFYKIRSTLMILLKS